MKQTVSFVFDSMRKLMYFGQHYSYSIAFFECKRGDIIPGVQGIVYNSKYTDGVQ